MRLPSVRVLLLAVLASVGGGAAVDGSEAARLATKPSNTALPAISGTTQQGFSLSTTTGTWSGTQPITYSYAWRRCNSSGSSCLTIGGATSASYVLVAADVSKTIRVVVTASNSAGSTSATSAKTAVVTAAVGALQHGGAKHQWISSNRADAQCHARNMERLAASDLRLSMAAMRCQRRQLRRHSGIDELVVHAERRRSGKADARFGDSVQCRWFGLRGVTGDRGGNRRPTD